MSTNYTRTADAIELLKSKRNAAWTNEARRWSRTRSELAANLCTAYCTICRREGIEDFSSAVDWHEVTYVFSTDYTRHIR